MPNFFFLNLLYSIILCSLLLWPLYYSIFLIDSYFSFNVIIISSKSFLRRFVFYFIISASGNKSTKKKTGIFNLLYNPYRLCFVFNLEYWVFLAVLAELAVETTIHVVVERQWKGPYCTFNNPLNSATRKHKIVLTAQLVSRLIYCFLGISSLYSCCLLFFS